MNTENVWIVVVLLVVILVGSNLFMFAIVRGWSRGNGWFKGASDKFTQPWGKEDKDWDELSQRVRELEKGRGNNSQQD